MMEPELQVFKAADSLWLLNAAGHLITCTPVEGAEEGYLGFISLEEATIFLLESRWDENLLAAHLVLEQLWSIETIPIHVITPLGQGLVAVQTLTKEDICGRPH